ncbi:HAD family hydrolase [Sulfurospirillum sp. 1612]|uniref:HAD family hydrolase n=1 Tax=Sulfurospirillum sp. 1612 TaxID=3094835 RepID=UPI002F92D03C
MKLKAVIFDLDGTLLDTLEDIAISVNHVLTHFGKTPIALDRYRYLVGEGAYKLMQNVLPDADDAKIKEALNLFEKHYATQYDKNTKPYEGIGKLLSFLQARDCKMAILSNKPNAFTKKCAVKYLRTWHFEAVYGIREHIERKPAADGVVAILKELDLKPAECLFVGDTKIDMMTAKNARMQSMGVLWGFRDEEELRSHDATYIAASPAEAIKIIQTIEQ